MKAHRDRNPSRKIMRRLCCCAAAVMATPAQLVSAAQSETPAPAPTRTYLPQEFARFSPRTALDLVQLVPGFIMADVEERRGLGLSGANVLIDGKPVRGKGTDAVDALSRIVASRVARLEVSSNSSSQAAGIGGHVVNVVLTGAAKSPSGQFTWRPATRLRDFDPSLLGGEVSVDGDSGAFEYSVGLRNDSLRTGASGPTRIFDADGTATEFRDDVYVERSDRPRLGADLRYKPASGAIFGLRGAYQRFSYRFRERSNREDADSSQRLRFLTQRTATRRFEIAGDADLAIGPGRLKLIGLHTREKGPVDTRVTTDFLDTRDSIGQRFLRDGDERSTALRSEYRWTRGPTDWLVSAERAVTTLDNLSSLFSLDPDGSFREVPLPGGSGDVRERRHEAALNVTHRLSSALTFQAALGGEISRLSLAGDADRARTFRRPKGYVLLSWQATPRLNVTARLERRVGQISFFDFLASRNLSEDRENQSNPALVPPQSWNAEAEFRRDLGALGSLTLRLYGQRIEDLVEQVPIGLTGEAPGNLARAHLYGVDWKTSLLLEPLGLPGVRADARIQFQHSEVDDPVTGRSRRISNNLVRLFDLSLRHDVPGTSWAYGAGLFHRRQAPDFRVAEVGRFREGPLSGNLFVERKNLAGLTVRAGVSNLIGSRQELDRFLFQPRRDGSLLSVERRRRKVGPILSLAVSGNF